VREVRTDSLAAYESRIKVVAEAVGGEWGTIPHATLNSVQCSGEYEVRRSPTTQAK